MDTDFLVVGDASPLWAAGAAGKKILEAVVCNERGAHIRWMNAESFLKLVT
jgi:hypothetical protein